MTTAPDHAAATDFALVAAKGETVLRGGPAPDYVQNLARAYLDATEWRTDFENAPHDGSHFMAYSGRDGILYTMHFSDGRMLTDNERWSGHVTHWRLLVQPPEHKP